MSVITCSNCGYTTDSRDNYCANCGRPFVSALVLALAKDFKARVAGLGFSKHAGDFLLWEIKEAVNERVKE